MEPEETTGTRPARYLIGWLSADAAIAALARRREEEFENPEHAERAEAARREAALRRPSVGLEGVISDSPPELRAHQEKLAAENPRLAGLFERGLRLALIDLRRVCALQQAVFTDVELPDIDFDDVQAFAGWTLRQAGDPLLDVHYNRKRRAWTVVVSDPNIRIVDHFHTKRENGIGLGFEIRQFGSSLQVVGFRDRFLLVDGYHRAFALLSRGIHLAPGLVGRIQSPEEIRELALGLTLEVVLGPRPPMLPDFLDDEVAAEVEVPVGPRILVVEAMDIRTVG
jgi:hypothetical protein